MKKIYIILSISLWGQTSGFSQFQYDVIVPALTIGKGIGTMKNLGTFVGFGHEMGVGFKNSSFGLHGFYHLNYYHNEKIKDISGYDFELMRSNFTNFGLKLRYSPISLQGNKFVPFVNIGGGVVTHRTTWKSERTYETEPYLYNDPGSPGSDGYWVEGSDDPDCPKSGYWVSGTPYVAPSTYWKTDIITDKFKDKLNRSTTFAGSLDLGFTYDLTENFNFWNNTSRLFVRASVGIEYGGRVSFIDHSKGSLLSYDYGNNTKIEQLNNNQIRDNNGLQPRHSVVMFRISFVNFLF